MAIYGKFKQDLFQIHGTQCCITKSKNNTKLEVCRIIPFDICNNYDINNALIMTSNFHRMFDAYLFSINPESLCVIMSDELKEDDDYKYNNCKITINENNVNEIKKYLTKHYNIFIFKNNCDEQPIRMIY